jgi:sterol desaturase/sphingolipid hydroxylase (fatty acid hydroxylase superfamily)
MSEFLSLVGNAYNSYWNYFLKELSNPFNNGGSYFYLLIGISIFAWVLEIAHPWRKNQGIIRKDFFLDAFYMFFNFFIFNLIIFIALSSVSERFFQSFMEMIHLPKNGIINLQNLPLWLQFISYFVIADLIQYSIHVFLHRNKFLWRVHKVHHSVKEMGFAAHLRYHWIETLVYKTGLYIVLSWFLNFELQNVFILHAFSIFIGHLNHTNINLDYGIFRYVLNNPKMHIWHHAKEIPDNHQYGVNFGITLSIWDYLFKTASIPHDGKDIELGFKAVEKYPKSFMKQFFKPFKRQD